LSAITNVFVTGSWQPMPCYGVSIVTATISLYRRHQADICRLYYIV